MADAQASGACYGNIVWVQVPSPASSVFSEDHMRKCRNWQTSKTKDLVVGTPCGFKSHLPQSDYRKRLSRKRQPFFYPFVISESQAIACMLMHSTAAIPRSQLITFTISSVLHHILFILGLAREQNIAAINKSHVTVSVQISFHSRPPCLNLFAFFYGLKFNREGVHMFAQERIQNYIFFFVETRNRQSI